MRRSPPLFHFLSTFPISVYKNVVFPAPDGPGSKHARFNTWQARGMSLTHDCSHFARCQASSHSAQNRSTFAFFDWEASTGLAVIFPPCSFQLQAALFNAMAQGRPGGVPRVVWARPRLRRAPRARVQSAGGLPTAPPAPPPPPPPAPRTPPPHAPHQLHPHH